MSPKNKRSKSKSTNVRDPNTPLAKSAKNPVFSARKKSSITGNSAISLAKNLVGGRPTALFASKHTRQIIRRHHTLLKRQASLDLELRQAQNERKNGADIKALKEQVTIIEKEIENNGGIEEYQKASIAGQSTTRGGDTSKLLVEWLEESWPQKISKDKPFSLLEIGCLSAENHCSTCGIFDPVERIDLNSQAPESIVQQDFMERTLPKQSTGDIPSAERFDFISLSLVVNYVPDHFQRGEMLRRTVEFLKSPPSKKVADDSPFPGLFLVLPAPCVLNSRYFTEERLNAIMEVLGYKLERRKETSKLVYWLYRLVKKVASKQTSFKREELNPGGNKNNFSICLK